MYTIITSFNQKYWEEVAKENSMFLDKYWPTDSEIILYHELTKIPNMNFTDRVKWKNLYECCPEIKVFGERWKDEPKANGSAGTNFRLNAIKFVHKTFAIWHAAKNQNNGWLVWIDCDAFIHKQIDKTFIDTVFDNSKSICYLGRPGKYSECGFLAFNLNHSITREFLVRWENLYVSGEFIHLPETHDSWTFDYIRKEINQPNIFFNLNEGTTTNKNPFANSKLGPYISHAKGADKSLQLEKLKKKHNK